MDGKTNGWIGGWVCGCVDEWMEGWMDGYTDVCLEGWVDRYPVYKEKISQRKKEGSKETNNICRIHL
jgi:hypothetical protein